MKVLIALGCVALFFALLLILTVSVIGIYFVVTEMIIPGVKERKSNERIQ